MDAARIAAIIEFLALANRLKHVERRGRTVWPAGTARQENSAEHCWNVALVALLLHREVADPPDLGHVLAMICAHDLVEIEEGRAAAARFAMACDRAQGFLQGVIGTGHWRQQSVTEAQTCKRMDPARKVAPVFEALIETLYERARQGGMFAS